ncbi:hypothetical protein JW960_01150 [candidate division KSB1 bacterium]|nr:hypothetical protein [candidate division KSB1 bacterium]
MNSIIKTAIALLLLSNANVFPDSIQIQNYLWSFGYSDGFTLRYQFAKQLKIGLSVNPQIEIYLFSGGILNETEYDYGHNIATSIQLLYSKPFGESWELGPIATLGYGFEFNRNDMYDMRVGLGISPVLKINKRISLETIIGLRLKYLIKKTSDIERWSWEHLLRFDPWYTGLGGISLMIFF